MTIHTYIRYVESPLSLGAMHIQIQAGRFFSNALFPIMPIL